jgi:hypothetical protein
MTDLYYRLSDPSDVRNLGEQVKYWNATGNPKANEWAAQPQPPIYDAATHRAPEWQDGQWVVTPLTPEELAALQPKPMVVSMRAFREACGRDLIIKINAYVASVADVYERFKIQNDLEFALTVSRAHPRVSQLAAAIGKTENEIDEVFELAQQLDAA